jgi:hypothetical protein
MIYNKKNNKTKGNNIMSSYLRLLELQQMLHQVQQPPVCVVQHVAQWHDAHNASPSQHADARVNVHNAGVFTANCDDSVLQEALENLTAVMRTMLDSNAFGMCANREVYNKLYLPQCIADLTGRASRIFNGNPHVNATEVNTLVGNILTTARCLFTPRYMVRSTTTYCTRTDGQIWANLYTQVRDVYEVLTPARDFPPFTPFDKDVILV